MNDESVKVVHLVSGPPLVAKVVVDDQKLQLEDPLTMTYSSDTDPNDPMESPKFTVRELLVLAEKSTIEVDRQNVLYRYTPLPEIVEQYNAVMVSKLTKVNS